MGVTYGITENLIHNENRPGTRLDPSGLAIHATATPGATAEREREYFAAADRQSSAHAFVDWGSIVLIIPWGEVAYHAGATANARFESIELCEPAGHDPARFAEVWKRGVWLARRRCDAHSWREDRIWSHDRISRVFDESDHTDPTGYFQQYGRTFEDFVHDVFSQPSGKEDPVKFQLTPRLSAGGLTVSSVYHPGEQIMVNAPDGAEVHVYDDGSGKAIYEKNIGKGWARFYWDRFYTLTFSVRAKNPAAMTFIQTDKG